MSSPSRSRIQRITSGVSTPKWSDGRQSPKRSPTVSPRPEANPMPVATPRPLTPSKKIVCSACGFENSIDAYECDRCSTPFDCSKNVTFSEEMSSGIQRTNSLLSHNPVTPARTKDTVSRSTVIGKASVLSGGGPSKDNVYTTMTNPLQSYYPDTGSKHHMVTFTEVAEELKNNYNFEESITSTSLDILALYLKGQKILHMEAKTLCEKRLNTLMLPAIFISSLCAILNFALNGTTYGPVLVSCFNVANAFLMSLISYLKLDAKAQLHQSSAYKYQKLEALCEFNSGRVLFFKEANDIIKLVDEIRNRVLEIKESNQFILPEQIRHRFHVIFSTNVFTLVKDIQNQEIIYINDLKVIIQKMQYIRGLKHKQENHVEELKREADKIYQHEKTTNLRRIDMIEKYINDEVVHRLSQVESSLAEDASYIREKIRKEIDRDVIVRIVDEDLAHLKAKAVAAEEECILVEQQIMELAASRDQLEVEKVAALKKAIEHRKEYLSLSRTFDTELKEDREKQKKRWDLCKWCKT